MAWSTLAAKPRRRYGWIRVAIGKIVDAGLFDEVHVPPAPGDSGTAIGAATGKPICGTPQMALDCLVGSGLDALMLEGWWVTK